MISFLRLGDFGQLGNQMFQFAAIYSLSKTNNLELKIPIETTYTRNYHGHKLDLFDSFNIPKFYWSIHFRLSIKYLMSDNMSWCL